MPTKRSATGFAKTKNKSETNTFTKTCKSSAKKTFKSLTLHSILFTSSCSAWDSSHPVKDNAEDLLVLTLGGERSPDVYAFSPQSLQETKVPNANIARKAGGAIFFNDTLIACGGVSEDVQITF